MSHEDGVPPDTGQAWRSSRANRVRETREAARAGMSRRRLFGLIGAGIATVGIGGAATVGGAFLSRRLGRQETSAVLPVPAGSESPSNLETSSLPLPSERIGEIAAITESPRVPSAVKDPTREEEAIIGTASDSPDRELSDEVIDDPVLVAEEPPTISIVASASEPALLEAPPLLLDYTLPENARLLIPAIEVDAPVRAFGVDEFGRMEAPDRPEEVGWFELGPLPGTAGNSILTGHVDWFDGSLGVFGGLKLLVVGDLVEFTDPRGVIASYRVLWQRTYVADMAPINEIIGQNLSLREMTMITCAGTFDATQRNYSHRLIVRCEVA